MPVPIRYDASALNLSPRVFADTTVDASPADSTETVIANLTVTGDIAMIAGILLMGYAAITVGTNGVTANLRIRRATVAGTAVAATGAATTVAANLITRSVVAFDAGAALPGQVYVLTLEIGSASAPSAVSAASLIAVAV